jgi:hypothetical protein
MVFDGGITAVAGFDVVRDVPKKFGIAAHARGLQIFMAGI